MLAQLGGFDHFELEAETDKVAGHPVEIIEADLEAGVILLRSRTPA